jgi:hypothetical protein
MNIIRKILGFNGRIKSLEVKIQELESKVELGKESTTRLRRDLIRLKSLTETFINEYESYNTSMGKD